MTRSAHPLSYYAATAADSAVCPALAGDLDCDICVIGGGYTGLSAALELARRGYDVVLLEANRVGWGASGRNGGQIVTGYSGDHVRLFRRLGPGADRRLWDLAEEAKALIGERVARHRIACDLKWGYIFAADKPRQLRELTQAAEHWSRDYDYAGLEPLDRPAIAARVGSRRYCGGLYDPGGGHLVTPISTRRGRRSGATSCRSAVTSPPPSRWARRGPARSSPATRRWPTATSSSTTTGCRPTAGCCSAAGPATRRWSRGISPGSCGARC
jgi:gamma-glutamylputrescine oxidase